MVQHVSLQLMSRRLVRYDELRPCRNAFVDTRNPGSEHKENFTIIGPGVSENPEQYVHIKEHHGFNIGGARQPPGCSNSQHSHETAEVFIIHSGYWRFVTGERGRDGHVDLGPGDTISIPTQTFRGFENIGTETGFMFSVLGGDDPGHVTWAPYVFEEADRHGLVLLKSGRLIDTAREDVPTGAERMPVTTRETASRLTRFTSQEISRCVVRLSDLVADGGLSRIPGFAECPIVGPANAAESISAGRMSWAHGFQLRALKISPEAETPLHIRAEEEVLLAHSGELEVAWPEGSLELRAGDTLTVPKGLARKLANRSSTPALIYVVRGGDHPQAPRWLA